VTPQLFQAHGAHQVALANKSRPIHHSRRG